MATLTAFLAAWGIELAGGAVSAVLFGWFLKKGLRAPAIHKLFDKWALFAKRLARLTDAFGKRKLGAAIADPLTELGYQLIGRFSEEYWAELRKNNPARLERYLEDLHAVKSKTRSDAITEKLKVLGHPPKPLQDVNDAGMFHRLNQFSGQSVKQMAAENNDAQPGEKQG